MQVHVSSHTLEDSKGPVLHIQRTKATRDGLHRPCGLALAMIVSHHDHPKDSYLMAEMFAIVLTRMVGTGIDLKRIHFHNRTKELNSDALSPRNHPHPRVRFVNTYEQVTAMQT